MKALVHVYHEEVQRAQAQHGKDVRREYDKRVGRDCEDGGNRVHREQCVDDADQQDDERKRRQRALAFVGRQELLPVEIR